MHVILEKIAEFAYQYGKDGARMPSCSDQAPRYTD